MSARDQAVILTAAVIAGVVIIATAHVQPPAPRHRCPCAVPYVSPSTP